MHLGCTTDMSTDSFLSALHRFFSMKGFVKLQRSGNGSNFIGAEEELKEALKQLD